MQVRRQATLFLSEVTAIEEMRCRFNPAQAKLIGAHVTLCREDEVFNWQALHDRLFLCEPIHVTLEFGPPVKDGNLVILPTIGRTDDFDELRYRLLSANGTPPRKHNPHVTIIHPRNGICSDSIFQEIAAKIPGLSVTFTCVSLIEQHNGGTWRPVSQFGDQPA